MGLRQRPMSSGMTSIPIRCLVLGGGGHAKVVIEALTAAGVALPYAVLDCNPKRWGEKLLGVPIRGSDDLLTEMVQEGVTGFVVGLGGTGDNRPRQRLFEMAL